MFTGIIEDRGVITDVRKLDKAARITLRTSLDTGGIKAGDSISVNGACLTVTGISNGDLSFDVSFETIALTNLKDLKAGEHVNLERALAAGGRFDGHIVSGHIDGFGTIAKKEKKGDFFNIRIDADKSLLKYVVLKGSIAVDGISLTVNSVDDSGFGFVIIPHTLMKTTLEFKGTGDRVNIETDILAKYIEKICKSDGKGKRSKVDAGFLAEHGFI